MRWKKNAPERGLAGVFAGPRGSELRIDGVSVASVNALHRYRESGWYWVAGWGYPGIEYKNTCNEPAATEAEAKAQAMQYVRACLKAAQGEQG